MSNKKWLWFIKKWYFNKYIKKSDSISWWIDYLRLTVSEPVDYFEKIMTILDNDNSNLYVDENNMITFQKVRLFTWYWLIGSVVYWAYSRPILLYNPFDRIELYKNYWKIDLYWTYFRLIELNWLENDFIEKLYDDQIDILEKWKITRLDYKYDIFFNEKQELIDFNKFIKYRTNWVINMYKYEETEITWQTKNNTKTKPRTLNVYYKGDKIQSRSYWAKQSKRIFTRAYNKLDDVSKKWKYLLYEDYYNYENVHRLEFQLMNHFTKWFTYENKDKLLEKFLKLFDFDYSDKIYEKRQETNLQILTNRIRYFKDFIWRWYKIYQSWYNPYHIITEWLLNKEIEKWELEKLFNETYDDYFKTK